jgi:hypothetical protein
VKQHIVKEEPRKLTIKNASGRSVVAALSSDPDVSVVEMVGGSELRNVAIEVKGGTDVRNARKGAGVAEKAHLKAKQKGYREFWTIISKKGLSMTKLQGESQTTTMWFDAIEVLGRSGPDWDAFREHLAGVIGIPLQVPMVP